MVFAKDIYFMRDLNIFLQLNNKKAKKKKNLIQKQAGHLMDISSKKKKKRIFLAFPNHPSYFHFVTTLCLPLS